ncbi:MAG: hypothetical protein H3C43_00690 [Leptonema sp. (in: Bacteria)]|nr:hypothetical protein [Leptonema sp. (in: bacteria)]
MRIFLFISLFLVIVGTSCTKSKQRSYTVPVDTLFNSWLLQDAKCEGATNIEQELKSSQIRLQLIAPTENEGATYIGNIPNDQSIVQMQGMALVTVTQDEETGDDIEITIHNEHHQDVGGMHFVSKLNADSFVTNWYYKDTNCNLEFKLAK